MSVFDDQKVMIQAQITGLNDRIAAAQTQIAQLQQEKAAAKQKLDDLAAAYLAWKGQQL